MRTELLHDLFFQRFSLYGRKNCRYGGKSRITAGADILYDARRQTIFTLGKNLLTLRGFIFAAMIVKLISKYLETHKRLVVPNLGAFIVKVPGQSVLFSNLIKNDDGVLRSLLTADGISDMEAVYLKEPRE